MRGRELKARLAAGQVAIGGWLTFQDPSVVEVMTQAGFDWFAIDMEHAPLDRRDAHHLIRMVTSLGVPCLVRLPANDATIAKQVMDSGADGIIVPMVNSADEARRAVSSVKYPPDGTRGVGLARAQGYGSSFEDYMATSRDSVVIVQIEHKDAVVHVDEIVQVAGVDGIFLGPYDLSGSLGAPGAFKTAAYQEAVARVRQAALAAGLPAGLHVVHPSDEAMVQAVHSGFRLIAFSTDFLLLKHACQTGLARVRASIAGSPS